MIKYRLGDKNFGNVDMNWKKFLSLIHNGETKYKSFFKSVSHFYEYFDRNKEEITEILFDDAKYYLEDGVLHNLYGSAREVHHDEQSFVKGWSYKFYIGGRCVCDKSGQAIKTTQNFTTGKIFFYDELTERKSGSQEDGTYYRRKEGVDFERTPINLEQLRKQDKRKRKLKRILNERNSEKG